MLCAAASCRDPSAQDTRELDRAAGHEMPQRSASARLSRFIFASLIIATMASVACGNHPVSQVVHLLHRYPAISEIARTAGKFVVSRADGAYDVQYVKI
jgi:hypothetical protein